MNIKTKISLGLFFLLAVILIVGGISIYYLKEISDESKNIIKANYESIEYMQGMTTALDSLSADSTSIVRMKKNLKAQEGNVTELGEMEETIHLGNLVKELLITKYDDSLAREVRLSIHKITDLNLKAIIRKNAVAEDTASQATLYVIVIVTICFLVSFSFILNFPGYIANPIAQLTSSIKAIADRNYEERLQFNRNDEFEELAQAFNSMAEKMDEYEHSNLANLLFEKKRIETIINRMNDPVIGLDDKRRIIFANTEAIELLNKKEEELMGHYAPDVAVTNDLLRRLIQDIAIPTMGSNGAISTVGAQDKQEKPIKIFAHGKESYFTREIIPISITHTGEKKAVPIGTVILLKNITPFKELDLAKTNFIATISHELKTPIASLQMGAKLLQDPRVGTLNVEQSRIVQTVNDETQRLMKITGELLDMAQVETGNIKLNLTTVPANDLIEQACEAVKFQAEQRHVRLHLNLPDKPSFVQADKDKTVWVLINFLTNAVRHSPENGDVFIRYHTERERVIFNVMDSGMGIEPKHLEKIFDRFYRVPGSDPKKGTGLGLSICKEFIEAQRGTVSVHSTMGKGSEFSFTLIQAHT